MRDEFSFPRRARQHRPRLPGSAVLCAAALVASASAGLCLLYAGRPDAPVAVAAAPSSLPPAIPAVRRAAALLDPSFTAPAFTGGSRPMTFSRTVALRASFQPRAPELPQDVARLGEEAEPAGRQGSVVAVAAAPDGTEAAPALSLPPVALVLPVPPSRPLLQAARAIEPAGRRRMAREEAAAGPVAAASQPDHPGFFDSMFGRAATGPALAYAAPEAGGLGLAAASAPDRTTAVYDIAAHLVTLPDGTRLEAHSGLGANKDDPRSVAEHMRGATPPAVYDLTPREALFHGVAALRLTPVGGGNPYGRAGLLAHTYMLGPRGDSNGCVVFRDYKAFRDAYDRGIVRRLVVVARGS